MPESVPDSTLTTVPAPAASGVHPVEGGYFAAVRAYLIALGAKTPDIDIANSGDLWQRCRAAGIHPDVCAATIYTSEHHRHMVSATTIQETSRAREAPVRDEWVVRVRRGAFDKIRKAAKAAGHPYDVSRDTEEHGFVVFQGFNDDEKAARFAADMTRFGFITSYGPAFKLTAVAEPKRSKKKSQAGESVNVVHEPVTVVHEGHIPWVKVARDVGLHDQGMLLAQKHGAISSTEKVYALVGPALSTEDQEIFLVIPLNLRGELKAPPYEVARGQRSKEVVGVEDVMRAVLDSGCEGFIAVHNHPSGDPTPSEADIRLTKQIEKATQPYGAGIKFLDHVIIGTRCCYSIFEKKRFGADRLTKAVPTLDQPPGQPHLAAADAHHHH